MLALHSSTRRTGPAGTPGSLVDPGGAYISIRAVSPWIQLAKIQGFQRIWRVLLLGEFVSAHQLTVKFAHDFSPTFDQTDNATVASDPSPYQWSVGMVNRSADEISSAVCFIGIVSLVICLFTGM